MQPEIEPVQLYSAQAVSKKAFENKLSIPLEPKAGMYRSMACPQHEHRNGDGDRCIILFDIQSILAIKLCEHSSTKR
jgi:hypothetical protein